MQVKRKMVISYSFGNNPQKPMIRIANLFLLKSGFPVGTRVQVAYENGIITITPCKSKNPKTLRTFTLQEPFSMPEAQKEAEREEQNKLITPEQKKLLTSLILERVEDENEREQWLQETESCCKKDASELFSLLMAYRI